MHQPPDTECDEREDNEQDDDDDGDSIVLLHHGCGIVWAVETGMFVGRELRYCRQLWTFHGQLVSKAVANVVKATSVVSTKRVQLEYCRELGMLGVRELIAWPIC